MKRKSNKKILSECGISSVKSSAVLYGAVGDKYNDIYFKCRSHGCDSAWYCKIQPNGYVSINTKYYYVPEEVKKYNKKFK